MSRIKRWFAGAASAALLLGLAAPATGHADDTPTNHAGACEGDTGVTVVVDYQGLGGGAEVRCFEGNPKDGVEALRGAGFTLEGVPAFGDSVVCRINDRPGADEVVPLDDDPDYTEDCSAMPPANGYWSYWSSGDEGGSWDFSQMGITGTDPQPGEWEGWSFSLNATASANPQPRTGLAMAKYRNSASTAAAADWIAGQWDPQATHFAAGLADNIYALAAAEAHPEIISGMLTAMQTAAPAYAKSPDALSKVLIALAMTGQDTHHFLGCDRDLVAELDTFVAANGTNLDSWWGPHLISIALNRLGKPVPQNVFDLLTKRQKNDGSFGFPDDSGLALSALVGIAKNPDNPQAMRNEAETRIARVVAWSKDPVNQKELDGVHYWTSFSPANSTGMLAGALAEAGEDITAPQAFLQAQQKLTGVGAWSNVLNGTKANAMATTQGIFGVAGKSYGTSTLEVPGVAPECSTKPAFTTQPASTTITAGEDATFTVAVTGNPTPGITWEEDVKGIWTAIKGTTGTTLTLKNVGIDSDGRKVRAVANNAEGYAVSDVATLTVEPMVSTNIKPAFTTQPASTTITAGGDATFTVAATGDPTPGITWEEDVKGIWTAIKGATGSTLTLRNVGIDSDGRKVRASAANAEGYAVSDIATLTVKPVVKPTPPVTTPPTYPETVYNTPGYHKVNGREWFTTCEKYSQTNRCRTTIKATKVTQKNGKFVATTDYVFNNLTYLPSKKELWEGNRLGYTNEWTSVEGRKWKTECNTPVTGNGCRSYIWATVIQNVAKPGQPVRYAWVNKWEFNNIVQYS